MTKGIAYIRKSKGGEQDNSGSQLKAVREWLERKGLTAETIEDEGSRDLAWKRPGFQSLMARVERGEVKWIVVAERDRFGVSDPAEWGYYITILRRHNTRLFVASEDKELTDTYDSAEPILAAVHSGQSRVEQVDKATRCYRAKLARVELGQWPGGKPPYGYDLVCAGELGGQELWRLVFEPGVFRRVRVWPDGKRDRYDGEGNVPGRDVKYQFLFLSPNPQQAKWVRKIFEWFNGGESYRGIANRLQAAGVPAIHRGVWHHATVRFIVSHPSYLSGVPVWNKFGHGRFTERVGGKMVPVERVGGRTRNARKREVSDHVAPPPGQGIIDQATWDATQARITALATNPRGERKPRSPELYFSGLVKCGDCGRAMTADSKFMIYRCATNMLDKTACWCNRVRHDVLTDHVEQYLADTRQTISLLDPEQCWTVIELEQASTPLIQQYTRRITEMWREARSLDPKELGWTYSKLRKALGKDSAERVESEIAEKEAEITRLADRLGKVKTEAGSAALLARIDAIGEEVRVLRQRREVDQLDSLRLRLRDLLARTEEARADAPARRASAVRGLIAEILPRHEHFNRGKLRASRLVGVVIKPRVDMSPGNQHPPVAATHVADGFLVRLLSRRYDVRAAA